MASCLASRCEVKRAVIWRFAGKPDKGDLIAIYGVIASVFGDYGWHCHHTFRAIKIRLLKDASCPKSITKHLKSWSGFSKCRSSFATKDQGKSQRRYRQRSFEERTRWAQLKDWKNHCWDAYTRKFQTAQSSNQLLLLPSLWAGQGSYFAGETAPFEK